MTPIRACRVVVTELTTAGFHAGQEGASTDALLVSDSSVSAPAVVRAEDGHVLWPSDELLSCIPVVSLHLGFSVQECARCLLSHSEVFIISASR